jgi:hypothetical protein
MKVYPEQSGTDLGRVHRRSHKASFKWLDENWTIFEPILNRVFVDSVNRVITVVSPGSMDYYFNVSPKGEVVKSGQEVNGGRLDNGSEMESFITWSDFLRQIFG